MKKIITFFVILFFTLLNINTVSAEDYLAINKSNPFLFYVGDIKKGDKLNIVYTAGDSYNGARILVIAEGIEVFNSYQKHKGLQNITHIFNSDFEDAAILIEPFSGVTHKLHSVSINDVEIDIFNPPDLPENYPYIPGLLYGLSGNLFNADNEIIDQTTFATDRNTFTHFTLRYLQSLFYEFDEPKTIYAYMLNTNRYIYLQLLDSNLNVLHSELITELNSKKIFGIDNITNVKYVRVFNAYSSNTAVIRDLELYGEDQIKPKDIKNINIDDVTSSSISLSFDYDKQDDFSHVELSIEEIGIFTTTGNNFTFENLKPDTEYKIYATVVNSLGIKSNPMIITVKTLEPPPPEFEIKNLKAKPAFNRVDLFWSNPDYEGFHHVRIYRKDNVSTRNPFMQLLFGLVVYADDDDFKPIFETNGTYFNDLTVEPDSSYEYKLTTNSEDGMFESQGVTIKVTTPPEPPPEMGGVDYFENENGDYVYKWTSPTKGQVKILVGGVEYATVPASNKQIVIPKADMKYTLLGNPDVRLIAISESGKEGKPINPNLPFSGVNLPLRVDDLLTTIMWILWILGPFILLVLAIVYSKKIIQLIRKSAENKMIRR